MKHIRLKEPQEFSGLFFRLILVMFFFMSSSCQGGVQKTTPIEPTKIPDLPTRISSQIPETQPPQITPTIPITIKQVGDENTEYRIPWSFFSFVFDKNGRWLAFETLGESIECDDRGRCVGSNIAVCNLDNATITISCKKVFANPYPWSTVDFQFSPDGKYFAVSTIDKTWIFDTANWRQIVSFDQAKVLPYIVWSYDSQGIFVQFVKDNAVLFLLNVNGESKSILSMTDVFPEGFPPVIPGPSYWGPTLSPDGDQIAYIKYYPDHEELWRKDLKSGDNDLLYKESHPIGENPQWSPDGRYIILDPGTLDLFDFQTMTIKTLLEKTTSPKFEFIGSEISWSPDGKQIALFLSTDDEETDGLYILDVESGEKKIIRSIKNGAFRKIEWSKDNIIYYSTNSTLGWIKLSR